MVSQCSLASRSTDCRIYRMSTGRPPSRIGIVGPGTGPQAERDCIDCGKRSGMKLKNVVHREPINIPLLYVCEDCGTTLTVPPREPPWR